MSAPVDMTSMRDALYEEPGPRMRRRIRVFTAISAVLVAALIGLVIRQFWIAGQLSPKYWAFFTQGTTWAFLGRGFLGTMQVAVTAGILALLLGIVLMLGRVSPNKGLSFVSRVVIDFFRGIPSLLLIYFFFLVVPQYGIRMPSFWMIALPITFTASGVLAEVLRAGVNAVPKGQVEAAMSLGMRRRKIMFKIVLPQAMRIVIPSLISQLVVVVKDTTLSYVVSYPDLLQNARVLIASKDALVSVYFVIAVIYIVLNYAINEFSVRLARKSGTKVITRTSENPI